MAEQPFAVADIDEQLAAYDRSAPGRNLGKAELARIRSYIERGLAILDPKTLKLRITPAGRETQKRAQRTALDRMRDAPVRP